MQSYKLLKRLMPHIRVRGALIGLGYLCTFIGVALNLMQPILFSYLIDRVLMEGKREWLVPILTLSVCFALGSSLMGVVRGGVFRYLGIRNLLDFRKRVLSHLRKIPLPEIEKQGPGKYTPLLGWDTSTLSNFLNLVIVELVVQCITIVIAVSMIFYMDWKMGLAALVSIPLLFLIPRLYQKKMFSYAHHIRTHNEEVGAFMFETIQGSREIRALGLEGWEADRNEKLYKNLISSSTIETIYRSLSSQSSVLAISVIIVFLYGFGSGQVLDGALTIGMLVAAVQYFHNLLQPILVMNNLFGDIKQGEVAMDRIEQFLEIPEEPMPSAHQESSVKPGIISKDKPEALVPFVESRNLKVSYEGVDIIRGIDFTVKPGQVAAFVGRSGSGKTTLFKTLIGFMPVESGELYLSDRPVDQWSRSALSKQVGMVFQETFIFVGTLYENIAIGNLSSLEDEVYEAACQAGLKSFIDSLPDGLHTRVDSQGFQLSGGQRQRVAIARIILRKPDILILDEPTSALDRITGEHVLSALHELMQGKTTLVSTHRIETIISADVIYVMEHGKIVDFGTHEELSGRCAYYKELLLEPYEDNEKIRSA